MKAAELLVACFLVYVFVLFGAILDRVGGGDGYAAGFIYGLLSGASEQEAVNLGWAHGALLTTFPGDTTMSTVEQVKAFAKGGSARIQR